MSGAAEPDQTGYQVDDLIVDVGQQRVTRSGTEIPLPRLSFELLLALTLAAPNLVTFDQLTERVWTGLVITPRDHQPAREAGARRAWGMTRTPRATSAGCAGAATAWSPTCSRSPSGAAPTPVTPYWVDESAAPAPWAAAPPDRRQRPGRQPRLPCRARPGVFGWIGAALAVLLLIALPWSLTHYLRAPRAEVRETAAAGRRAAAAHDRRTATDGHEPRRGQQLPRRRPGAGTVGPPRPYPRPAGRLAHLGVPSSMAAAPTSTRLPSDWGCDTFSRAVCSARASSCA